MACPPVAQSIAVLVEPIVKRPLLCVTLLWIVGIVLAMHSSLQWTTWALAASVLLLASLLTAVRGPVLTRIALALAIVGAAVAVTSFQEAVRRPDLLHGGICVEGYPIESPPPPQEGWRIYFHVERIRQGDFSLPLSADVLLQGSGTAPSDGRRYLVTGECVESGDPPNPYGFSRKEYLAQHGLATVIRAAAVTALPATAPVSFRVRARMYLDARLYAAMPGSNRWLYAGLLEWLVLGYELDYPTEADNPHGGPLPQTVVQWFRAAGIVHIIVVSGSQITLVAGILLWPLFLLTGQGNRAGYPWVRIGITLFALPLLGLYVAVADRGPSVDRALYMALLVMITGVLAVTPLARARSYRPDALTILAASVLVILIIRPALLDHPGLQLTYGAMFGLLTLTRVLFRLMRRWPWLIALPLAATFGTQLMVAPVLAWDFGSVQVLGPVTNLLAFSTMVVLLPLGLLTFLFASCWLPAATLLNWVNRPLLGLLLWMGRTAYNLPWSQVHWYVRSPWVLIVYYAGVAALTLALMRWADIRDSDWTVPAGHEPRMW